MAVSHVSPQFQISARAETSHVIATKFQPGGRAEISARAEIRHVIGPLNAFEQTDTSLETEEVWVNGKGLIWGGEGRGGELKGKEEVMAWHLFS